VKILSLKNLREEIIPECNGCLRILNEDEKNFCCSYISPQSRWRIGKCPLFDTNEKKNYIDSNNKKTRPQKQRKKKK